MSAPLRPGSLNLQRPTGWRAVKNNLATGFVWFSVAAATIPLLWILISVAVKGARAFALGVQWHPEYKAMANPDSVLLFKAFGDAVRARREARARAAAA